MVRAVIILHSEISEVISISLCFFACHSTSIHHVTPMMSSATSDHNVTETAFDAAKCKLCVRPWTSAPATLRV